MIRLGVMIWAFSTGHPWVGVFMLLSLLSQTRYVERRTTR